jgi:hypothetical protein
MTKSCQVRSGQVRSGQVRSTPVKQAEGNDTGALLRLIDGPLSLVQNSVVVLLLVVRWCRVLLAGSGGSGS